MEKKEIKEMVELGQQENNKNEYDGCDVSGLYWMDHDLYPGHETWPEDPRDQYVDD